MDKNKQQTISPGLYLVSTPIGNMEDITYRALNILKKSDLILCEDTRRSSKLLFHFKIKNKLLSFHKFNEKKINNKIIELIRNEKIISLISDAGTPSISDPGTILVQECIKNNLEIIPIPGPSSVSSAVSISGFSEKFLFYGFFPEKNKILTEDLKNLSNLKCSIVFFVSPKKINRIIPLLKKNFSGRKILICREMTKYYEEFIRTKVDTLDQYDFKIKGELTLVVSEKEIDKKNSHILKESDKKIIKMIINKLSIKEITNLITQNSKVSKKDIYNYCIKLKNEI